MDQKYNQYKSNILKFFSRPLPLTFLSYPQIFHLSLNFDSENVKNKYNYLFKYVHVKYVFKQANILYQTFKRQC
jgi:hypothetical protein